jgi:glycosyltransferase involved in cell wall biosynthesis
MNKFKIAIIRPIGYPIDLKSYNSQEIGLARALTLQGVNVDVFLAGRTSKPERQKIVTTGEGELHVYQLPYYKIPEIDHAIYPHLKGILIKNQYNLFHVNEENEITSFLVAKLGKKIGVPVVIYQGMYQQLTGRIRAAFQTLYDHTVLPWLSKNIYLALAKTTSAEKHLKMKGFENTLVMPVGLDTSAFDNPTEIDWRAKLKISRQAKIILYIGVFEKRRNIQFLLDLAKLFINKSDLFFVFVGKGDEFETAKIRTEKEQLVNVRLPGHIPQSELPSLYKEGTLFLLPSNYEIYGMVVLESMFFGVPVISTSTAGPKDIIENGINGYLIETLNLNKWKKLIDDVIENENELLVLKKNSQIKILSELTWENISLKYISKVLY